MGCTNARLGERLNGTKTASPSPQGLARPTEARGENLLDKYALGKMLAQGAFGVVYTCRRKGTSQEYAVKMIDQVETPKAEIKQEIHMLQKLAHPCVVKLVDVFYERVFVCIVMEKLKGGDTIEGMQLYWKTKGMIPVPVLQNMSKMMFQAIDWLHSNHCVHRDLKGDNFLQDDRQIENPRCRIYLSDFGTVVSTADGRRLKQKCGTKTYWSPEFYDLNYGIKVDIWALGVVIYGMALGRFPFKAEEDTRNKVLKFPSRMGEDGEDFLSRLLDRIEDQRFSSKQALAHKFVASIVSSAEKAEPFEANFVPDVKETGANAGIQERRRELVDRLEQAQNIKDNAGDKICTSADLLYPCFKNYDRRNERTTFFEWWSPAQVAQANLIDQTKAKVLKGKDAVDIEISDANIHQMLAAHNIPVHGFGKGQAKCFGEFSSECKQGLARLMLDASRHKSLVRCVDIVLLRISYGSNASRIYIVKTAEKYPDGRARTDINQLVGAKKLPYENSLQTARRIVKERLYMQDCRIMFNYKKREFYEEEEESPSYPGVRTVYRKEILAGVITTTDPAVLQRIGISTGAHRSFTCEDSHKYTHYYRWMTSPEADANKVKLGAAERGKDVSALVAPPIGLDEHELHEFLRKNDVDVRRFGHDGVKSLAVFSDELVKGEAALERKPDGNIIRVVDVLVLKASGEGGKIIVESGHTGEDGVMTRSQRLPAVKRRPDENQFVAARRVLQKVLKINETLVVFDPTSVLVLEEETTSKAYAGLPTLYRKRIISAKIEHP